MSVQPFMTLTAVLLAGGQSRRMGRDKATLVLEGRLLWERQLALLCQLPVECVWVSARAVPEWCPAGIETITDTPPSRGPLSGLAASLQRLRTTHLLVLAIDLPHMTASHLCGLWQVARPGCGVVPLNGDTHEPLCAIYPREALSAFTTALKGSSAALQPLIAELVSRGLACSHPVPARERKLYHNLNTPAELAGIRRRCQRSGARVRSVQGPIRPALAPR